jgi:hypothetical protein
MNRRPRLQSIEEACRQLGVAHPQRMGDMLPPEPLKQLFRRTPKGLHLWVTDVFHRVIDRIPPERCFHFWKHEVQERLLEDGGFVREAWPGGYAYLAQRWASPFEGPLVELMRCD